MKKKLSALMALIILMMAVSMVNVNAEVYYGNSHEEYKEVDVIYYWASNTYIDIIDPIEIYQSNSSHQDVVATYEGKNTFYQNQNCFTMEGKLEYSTWFQGRTDLIDHYSLPVQVSYTVNYISYPIPQQHTFSYKASIPSNPHRYDVTFNSSYSVSTVYIYHLINATFDELYNPNYTTYMITYVYHV